jgi:hypothetical protein
VTKEHVDKSENLQWCRQTPEEAGNFNLLKRKWQTSGLGNHTHNPREDVSPEKV